MLKAKWWNHVSHGLKPNNAECICRKVGKKLKRPALLAFIIHCGTKSARIVPSNSLKHSYTRFLPESYLNFLTRTPKSKPYNITLPKYTVNTLVGSLRYLITLLSTPSFITMLNETPTKSHCWAILNPNTLLNYTPSYYISKQFPNSIHCWALPNPNTLFR